jgi:hypothetical protein
VVLREDTHLDTVENLVDDACMILAGEDRLVLEQGAPSFPGRDVVGLVDGKVTSQVVKLLDVRKINEVFTTSVARRPFTGWSRSVVKVDH